VVTLARSAIPSFWLLQGMILGVLKLYEKNPDDRVWIRVLSNVVKPLL
jgi:hypothetical protein